MRLTQRTPEAREAYVQGYAAAVAAAVRQLNSLGMQCCGGNGDALNPATKERWGETYFVAAKAIELSLSPQGIVETYEMKQGSA